MWKEIPKADTSKRKTSIRINHRDREVFVPELGGTLQLVFLDDSRVDVYWEANKICKGIKAKKEPWVFFGRHSYRTHHNPYIAASQLAFELI